MPDITTVATTVGSAYSWFEYGGFFVVIILALLIDLFAHKQDKAISPKSAAAWTAFWVFVALCFGGYIWKSHGMEDASMYLTGYVLEKSLSVDNLFVMMAIFANFAIPEKYQHRVLFYGILGAIFMRMLFVGLGASFIKLFGIYALAIFGIFILWSAFKMWQSLYKDHEEDVDYSAHWAVRMTRKIFPVHTQIENHDFFIKVKETGKTAVTPLFLCLIVIEFADVMFAFDSVPAILAITQKTFLVYTSNIFAILGMRSMYFLLASAKKYLCHLEKAVIAILVFIGIKMLLEIFNQVTGSDLVHITPNISLMIVLGLLCIGIFSSYLFPCRIPTSSQDK